MSEFKNTDKGHIASEIELARLEKELNILYNRVSKEVTKEITKKLEAIEIWKEKNIKLLENNPTLYYQRLQNKYLEIDRSKKIVAGVTNQISSANVQAMAIVNDKNLSVYAINHNYAMEEINRQVDFDIKFTIYNKNIVKQLVDKNPSLFPQGKIDIPKDKLWNQKKIKQTILSDVIQGKSVPKIAEDLRCITDMNKNSSIRNARTLVTQTQNKARVDNEKEIEDMGIIYEKVWVSTPGGRTRDAHRKVNGQVADEKGYFRVGGKKMEYPGDKRGGAANVYNCRCSIKKVVKGFDKKKVDEYVSKNS